MTSKAEKARYTLSKDRVGDRWVIFVISGRNKGTHFAYKDGRDWYCNGAYLRTLRDCVFHVLNPPAKPRASFR